MLHCNGSGWGALTSSALGWACLRFLLGRGREEKVKVQE